MSLKAENLSFSYENGGRHVLTRISLKIEPGERVGLVAPSGYGKTTLCRLLAGYERPEAGTVEIDSIPIENIRGCMPVQLIWQHPEQALNPRWRMRQVLSGAFRRRTAAVLYCQSAGGKSAVSAGG